MQNPYLLLGFHLAVDTPANRQILDRMIEEVEGVLGDARPMARDMPNTYSVQLPATANGFRIWQRVATAMSDADRTMQGNLQWFAHLADRRGCEYAPN